MKKLTVFLVLTFSMYSFAIEKIPHKKASVNKETICIGADKPWTKEQTRFRQDHLLFKYAVNLFGSHTQCSGKIDSTFEGKKFGVLTYKFKNKATLKFDAKPPETLVVTLESPQGFGDENQAIAKIEEVAEETGLKITLDEPEIEKSELMETKTFWDSSEGTNGRLFLVYKNKKLVNIGYGMAL
jgi:hypothetical protein